MYKEAPKGWKELKLAQLIDFYIGGDWGEESQISSDYVETKVIRATDISNWEKTNGKNAQIRYLKTSSLEKRELKEGDIVIEISGGSPDQPVGRSIVIKKDKQDNKIYTCSNFFRLIRIDNNEVLPEFLNYYFRFLYDTRIIEQYQSNSTNLRNLKFKQFIAQKIPYPSELREQQEIVQVLDTMSDIISLREECISHAQDLIPALFQEMFKPYANYTKTALNNLFEFKSGGTPSKQVEEYFQGDIPWITTVALNKLFIGKEDANELITEEAIQKSATKLIPANSLLFGTRVGIGKLAINTVPMCTNQDIVAMIPFENNNLNLVYAYWYLKQINNFFVANGRGATIQGITTHLVRSTEIILPPLKVQEQFAQKVIEIESYIKEQQEELENAKQMFQSLLHHAFTGELTRRAYGE